MSEIMNHIDINSDLGKKLKRLEFRYFSGLATFAMEEMDEEAVDRVYKYALEIGGGVVDAVNAIADHREHVAVMASIVCNLAASLYLTIDQAMTAMEIEETFGGGDDDRH